MKKFVTIAAAAAFLFTGLVNTASAQTTQEQIEALLAQLAALQGETVVSGECAAEFTYSGVLRQGSRGQAVMDLQADLNTFNNAGIAVDGAFGPGTRAAVVSFQASQGLVADGIVGLQTANALGAVAQASCANGGNNGGDMNLPEGCTSTMGYSPVTGERCDMDMDDMDEDDDENDADEDDFPMTGDGDEASLEDYNFTSEDDAQEGMMEHVATAEFDVEDGDFRLDRIDLTFVPDAGNDEDEPWDSFETITLQVDGDEIASEDVDDEDDWLDDDEPYEFRFNDIDFIAEDGDQVEVEIWVTAQDGVDGVNSGDATWTIYIEEEGIRGLDTAGIDQYTGDEDDTVTFDIEEEGDDADLDFNESSNNPDEETLAVDADTESEWYDLVIGDLEAEGAEFEIEEATVEIVLYDVSADADLDDAADVLFDEVISDLEMMFGDEEFDDYDVNTSLTGDNAATLGDVDGDGDNNDATYTVIFDLDDEFMLDDEEVQVSVMVEFQEAEDYPQGQEIMVSIVDLETDGPDGADVDIDVVDGELHSLSIFAIDAELEDEENSERVETYTIAITADDEGEDVLIPAGVEEEGSEDATTGFVYVLEYGTVASATIDNDDDLDEEVIGGVTYYRVDAGETEEFEVRFNFAADAAAEDDGNVTIEAIQYTAKNGNTVFPVQVLDKNVNYSAN